MNQQKNKEDVSSKEDDGDNLLFQCRFCDEGYEIKTVKDAHEKTFHPHIYPNKKTLSLSSGRRHLFSFGQVKRLIKGCEICFFKIPLLA